MTGTGAEERNRSAVVDSDRAFLDPVLVLGSGIVGSAVSEHLAASGRQVVAASRRNPGYLTVPWVRCDVSDADNVSSVSSSVGAGTVVFAHGPSDPDGLGGGKTIGPWRVHPLAARLFSRAVPAARMVLISTDNVFSDAAAPVPESARPVPRNLYGRCKRLAELHIERTAGALIVRVSLVYQHGTAEEASHGLRETFPQYCQRMLAVGNRLELPWDQWITPVTARDLGVVMAELLRQGTSGLVHVGGTRMLSRYQWGIEIAEANGYCADRVTAIARQASRWASRPMMSCLRTERSDLPEAVYRLIGRSDRCADRSGARTQPQARAGH
jgi:dTDP-4-dehydrorhamnose reductase